MQASEVAKLVSVIAAAYPSFEVDKARVAVWVQMIGDLDYELAETAVRRHIALTKFPPTIAEIREQALEAARGPEPTGAESWMEFIHGIRRYSLYSELEAMESFCPTTRRVAQAIGWRDAYMSDNVDVLRGQYLRMFDQLRQRDNLEAIAGGLRLPGASRSALTTGGHDGEA